MSNYHCYCGDKRCDGCGALPPLKELVGGGNKATFVCARKGELIYKVGGFKFPVPFSDMGDGEFLPEDKAIFFMRWIRKALEDAR